MRKTRSKTDSPLVAPGTSVPDADGHVATIPDGQVEATAALQAAVAKARQLVAEGEGKESETKYALGRLTAEVRGGRARYGEQAVSRFAQQVGLGENTLRRYERISEVWTPEEFRKLLSRKGTYGRPLSWSHLDVLSVVADARRRDSLMEEALTKGLSVRELDALARESPEGQNARPEPSSTARRVMAVRRLTAAAEGILADVQRMDHELLQADGTPEPEVAEALSNAALRLNDLARLCCTFYEHVTSRVQDVPST